MKKKFWMQIKPFILIGLIILLIHFVPVYADDIFLPSQSTIDQPVDTSGPGWIKQKLVEGGVFNLPEFNYTTDYDQYKIYNNIKGLFINGLDYHNKPTRVFCWYGVPGNIQPGEKLPAVILVHGGGSTAIPEWVKVWNDHGYIAISIALEGQVPGVRDAVNNPLPFWPTFEFSGPFRDGFFKDIMTDSLQDQWFFHAVADVILANSLIRSFPEVDTSKIGITGISWGGILTNVITGIDNRYSFSVPVYGCGYLYKAPLYIKQVQHLSGSALQFYLNNWEPSLYVPLQLQPTLFVNGDNDCHFSMNSFTDTYLASTNEKYLRIEHNMVHGMAPGWAPETIYEFADYIVKGGNKPPEFTFENLDKKGELKYSFTGHLSEAKLYVALDTSNWECENYKWTEKPAIIDQAHKIISCTLPQGTEYFYINGKTAEGILYSSSMKKVEILLDVSDDAVLERDPAAAVDSFFLTSFQIKH